MKNVQRIGKLTLIVMLVVLGACENQEMLKVSTVEEKKAAITATAELLRSVLLDVEARKEVMATIASGYYVDEQVALRDLMSPTTASVYQTTKFQQLKSAWKVKPGTFAALWRRMQASAVGRTAQVEGVAVEASAALYFPYSNNFVSEATFSNAAVTVVPAIVEANSMEVVGPTGEAVLVNDAYAQSNPVVIVQATAPIVAEGTQAFSVPAVILGYARCSKHYDKLISFTGNGGGSEIMFARISGYLAPVGGQITSVAGDVIRINFSRGDVNSRKWRTVLAYWDFAWHPNNLEQIFASWEDDTQGTKTITGSIQTTLKSAAGLNVTGTIGVNVVVNSDDGIIRQLNLERADFLERYNLSLCGAVESQAIWDCGASVSYTFQVR